MAKKKKRKNSESKDKAVEETKEVEETSEEVEETPEEVEASAEASEEAKEEKPKAKKASKKERNAAKNQLAAAKDALARGNNQKAREILVELLERGQTTLEERESATAMLGQIELDINTLLVGAVAMLTLVLIPTVGLVKALWALPLLFPILLPMAPGVVGMLSFWVIPFLLPMDLTWHVKFFVPLAGFVITLILLFVQRSPAPATGSSS